MIHAVIFDLDGVIVSTDSCHAAAWRSIAADEGIPVPDDIGEQVRGISRMESLELVLKNAEKTYTQDEKEALAARKNALYRTLLGGLSAADLLPGVADFLRYLKNNGIRVAIGSSSKNTAYILKKIGLADSFDAVADGTMIQNSKPDPEVFLLAAELLGVAPRFCAVIEDAPAGIDAAKAAGMFAVAVGYAAGYKNADLSPGSFAQADCGELFRQINEMS